MDAITLSPSSTGLLIVDVQEKLLPAMHAPDAARMLRCIDVLVEAARCFAMPVWVTEQYPQGLGHTLPALAERVSTLTPAPLVVEKTSFSALGHTELARAISSSGVRAVIVVGVESHVCVFQTARELVRRGVHTHIPFDAVASREPACRSTALELLAQRGAVVTSTETVVFDLIGDAKNEHFRALSKLVRALVP